MLRIHPLQIQHRVHLAASRMTLWTWKTAKQKAILGTMLRTIRSAKRHSKKKIWPKKKILWRKCRRFRMKCRQFRKKCFCSISSRRRNTTQRHRLFICATKIHVQACSSQWKFETPIIPTVVARENVESSIKKYKKRWNINCLCEKIKDILLQEKKVTQDDEGYIELSLPHDCGTTQFKITVRKPSIRCSRIDNSPEQSAI